MGIQAQRFNIVTGQGRHRLWLNLAGIWSDEYPEAYGFSTRKEAMNVLRSRKREHPTALLWITATVEEEA